MKFGKIFALALAVSAALKWPATAGAGCPEVAENGVPKLRARSL